MVREAMSFGGSERISVGGSAVLRHVIESISPASEAHRGEAKRRLRERGPMFDRLGGQLAAAQHGPPRAAGRTLVIAAGDHGAGDPGVCLGDQHPTVIAARAIDDGDAAVRTLARAARASVLLLDCGCAGSAHMPAGAVAIGRRPSGDARQLAALTPVEVIAALEAGIAVAVSLLDGRAGDGGDGPPALGTDVLALGAIGLGSELATAALAGALLGPERSPALSASLDADERALVELGRTHAAGTGSLDPLAALAAFGGPETATLTGLILAAASMNLPIILDGSATGAAALIAARLAPAVTGYLIASQQGHGCMPAIVAAFGLESVFFGGVGYGEGAGSAMVLGLLDAIIPCPPPSSSQTK
jgi:nicotinate-nucleotide--dimethylbenzimidazole phosphoribosyltransferase